MGWLGVIHAAGQGPDGTPLAVRTLAPERLADVGRLAQVLSFAAQHEHQHVLPVSMPGTDGGEVFYLMPLAQGGSLRGVFERYRAAGATVDVDTMLDVARQVAEGLDFAHAHGTLHGNLKPENVLLQPLPAPQQDEFRLLLSDFGLNSLRPPDPHSPYLPGPQRSGAATTPETDLYSLGALLFEGVSGRPLPPQPLPADLVDVPEPAAKVVARCLGLSAPFADTAAFLGYLKALQVARQTGGGVRLSADHSYLEVVPGESQEVRLKLSSDGLPQVQLLVEGLPPAWTPALAPVPLQPGKEAVVHLTFQVPRRSTVRAGMHEVSIVAVADLPNTDLPNTDLPGAGAAPERLEVGRLPLHLRVQPFDASLLRLTALQSLVGQSATINATLRNEGNQTQRYNLEVNVPEGSAVRKGSARRQLELAPGAEFSEILDVRLPAAGLSSRLLTFTALANSVPRPTPDERGDDLLPAETWPPVYNTVQDHVKVEQRPLIPWWALALGVAALLGAGVWAARPPQIESFAVQGDTPMQGEPFTLAWRTSGARQVQIAELPGQAVDTSGQVRVPGVNGPQTYTLLVSGLLTQKKQQVTVTPARPAPHIDTFKVTPARAKLGETVRIEWNVRNAQKVTLQPFGTVPASGAREFVMQRDTRVQLSAQKGATPSSQDVTSTQTVTLAAPEIREFSLAPASAMRGQNVTVRWAVTGASRVRLHPLGELPPTGTRTFQATQTANYTLKASNGQVEKTASASLTVRIPQASIEAMTITPPNPVAGQPVKVQWRTKDASRAELRWGNQRQTVAPSGSLTVTAGRDLQSVTLVAENANGVPSMETRRVQVRAPAAVVTAAPAVTPAPDQAAGTTGQDTAPRPGNAAQPSSSRASSGQSSSVQPSSGQSRPAARTGGTSSTRQPGAATPARPTTPTTRTPTAKTPTARTPTNRTPANRTPTTSAPAPAPARPTAPAAAAVQSFTYRPATRAGGPATLSWKVGGASRVRISGLTGPNPDGTFPASGSVPLPANASPGTYTLSAGNGAASATVRVPATRVTSRTPGMATATAYPGIAGAWNHSFGQMNLQVNGSRVSGSLLSSRSDLPSGSLRGTLSGDPASPTLNAFVTGNGERVALIVRFDQPAHTFDGLYASRSSRVPWCGWKSPGANPCP